MSDLEGLPRYENHIDGRPVAPVDGRYLPTEDPYTGKIWASIPRSAAQDVDNAVLAADRALASGVWRNLQETIFYLSDQKGHVAVTWNVETKANVLRGRSWKTVRSQGGGTLFNFASHLFHYLEWFGGPLTGMAVRSFPAANGDEESDTVVTVAAAYRSGASASASVSTAAFMGSGHRLEFYGEEGSLFLENPTRSYMRGFTLREATRKEAAWGQIGAADAAVDPDLDERVGAVAYLAGCFLDWITGGRPRGPNFSDGLRVQTLLEVAQRSHRSGSWVDIT